MFRGGDLERGADHGGGAEVHHGGAEEGHAEAEEAPDAGEVTEHGVGGGGGRGRR